jgi:dolichol-phosphate mannosyltransferase
MTGLHSQLHPAPEISVVIPTFNEVNNVADVIAAVAAALEGVQWEAIVVDDDSPDGTAERVKQIACTDPRVRCLRRIGRRGLAGACIEGMLSSSAPYVAVMDADLQHDPSILPKMLGFLRTGEVDLAIGSRHVDGGSASGGFSGRRAAISRWSTRVARLALRTDVQDLMSGFFAIRRDRFDEIAPRLATSGFKILADIIATSETPLRCVELGYTFKLRVADESKLGARVALDFIGLLVEKATRGVIPATFVIFCMIGAVGVMVHLAVLWAMLSLAGADFPAAQASATVVAMTSNFFLNNSVTYRDQMLKRTVPLLRGLVIFWALCSFGAIANIGIATLIYQRLPVWWLAGLIGLAVSAVWNYTLSSLFVWSRKR